MKKIILFVIISLPLFVNAQISDSLNRAEKYPNFIRKGDFSVNASYTKNNKILINGDPYGTQGAELNLSYYLLNRFGIESGISTHHYKYLLTQPQETKQFDKKNLFLLTERIRYNFYDKPHCASAYLQTGYSFGWFNSGISKKIHRWEIGTLGIRASFTRQFIPNLDYEVTAGIQKDNLSSKISVLYKLGLTYNLGNYQKGTL